MPHFLVELKRRNVIRVGVGYLAVSWLILQAGDMLSGLFALPPMTMRVVFALLVLGLLPTLVFSWIYEMTPEGLKREREVPTGETITHLTGRKLDNLVIGVLAAVVALLLLDKFVLTPRTTKQPVAETVARTTPAVPQAPTVPGATNRAPAASPAAAPSAPVAIPTDNSIAVLPFADMSQSKDQEYFSDGLSEELLNLLAQIPQLRVIARTSSFSFKGKEADIATIAKTLNVANVLEGSVRKSGNRLRITTQLIRASDSSHLWSETYDRELTDVFAVQDEIAGAVVAALKLKLLPDQKLASAQTHTTSPEAYNEVLLGRQLYNRGNLDGWRRSLVAYRNAIELDPAYAPAYAGLVWAETYTADYEPTLAEAEAAKQRALAAAERAIALDPMLAEAYAARGYVRFSYSWDWAGAQGDYERAVSLDPNDSTVRRRHATLLTAQGRIPEAIAEVRKAIDMDPLSGTAWDNLGDMLATDGNYDEALQASQRALAINPDTDYAQFRLGYIALRMGDVDTAFRQFNEASMVWRLVGVSLAEHTRGNAAASNAALGELETRYAAGWAYQIAEIHAWRGEKDPAFEWLDRAFVQHDAGLTTLKTDPLLASLRDDPRYGALLRRLGLPE